MPSYSKQRRIKFEKQNPGQEVSTGVKRKVIKPKPNAQEKQRQHDDLTLEIKRVGPKGATHDGSRHRQPSTALKRAINGNKIDVRNAAKTGSSIRALRNVYERRDVADNINLFASRTIAGKATTAMIVRFLSHFLVDGFNRIDMDSIAMDKGIDIQFYFMNNLMFYFPLAVVDSSSLGREMIRLDNSLSFWTSLVKKFGTFFVPTGRRIIQGQSTSVHNVPGDQIYPSAKAFILNKLKKGEIPPPSHRYLFALGKDDQPVDHLKYTPVLNGDKGSWSGTDDVANTLFQFIRGWRVRKEFLVLFNHTIFHVVDMDVDETINFKRKRSEKTISKTLIVNHKKYKPVLNGNNGSWSGTDDVDNITRMDAIRRARKQYHNRQFRRPYDNLLRAEDREVHFERLPGDPPVNNRAFQVLAAQRHADIQNAALLQDQEFSANAHRNCPSVDEVSNDSTEVESDDESNSPSSSCDDESQTGKVLVKGCNDVGWDGKLCYRFKDDHFINDVGLIHPHVLEGDRFPNAVDPGYGYLTIVNDGGSEVSASSCCSKVLLPEYFYLGSDHREETYSVFWPLYIDLSRKFPTNIVKAHTSAAAHATSEKEFMTKGVPPSLCVSTTRYFLALKTYMASEEIKNTPGATPEDHDNENVYYCHAVGVTVDHGALTRKYGSTCVLEDEYVMNNHFSVSMTGGTVNVVRRRGLVDLDLVVYPRFDTLENETPKYYKSMMFNFGGSTVEPFVLFDVNGANAAKACKRLFAARDEEELYTHCQYRLGYHMARQMATVHRAPILDVMRVQLGPDANEDNKALDIHDLDPDDLIRNTGLPACTVQVGHGRKSHSVFVGDDSSQTDRMIELYDLLNAADILDLYAELPLLIASKQDELVSRCGRDVLTHVVDLLRTTKKWLFYVGYDAYLTHLEPFISRDHIASLPHVKRQLRMIYVKGAQIHDTQDLMVSRLGANVKKEMAKFKKVPRLYVTYGAGSMYANQLPEFAKVAIDGYYHSTFGKVVTTIYIIGKPRSDTFDRAFADMRDSVGGRDVLYIVLYSDDSVYAGNINGVPFLFNVDISSCDAGQRWPIFLALHQMYSVFCPQLSLGTIKQCTLPIDIRNPSNKAENCVVEMDGPFEGSGTPNTTILNHVGNYFNAVSSAAALGKCRDSITSSDSIQQCILLGATLVGHKVTIEDCGSQGPIEFEKAQLLKNSMFKTVDDQWTYGINYGTIYRSLGTYDGDMTQSQLGMDFATFKTTLWKDRMDLFVGGVIQGLCHEPSSTIIDALRQRFTKTIDIAVATQSQRDLLNSHGLYEQSEKPDRSQLRISDESLCARYDCTLDDLQALANKSKGIRFGVEYSDEAVDCFYRVDYGACDRVV
jgi:hypothetical protein